MHGRLVKTFLDGPHQAGYFSFILTSNNLNSGIYIIKLLTENNIITKNNYKILKPYTSCQSLEKMEISLGGLIHAFCLIHFGWTYNKLVIIEMLMPSSGHSEHGAGIEK